MPKRTNYLRGAPATRFWAKVDKSGGPDACWLWIGGLAGKGYGRFYDGTRDVYAHRWAWEQANGPIPTDLQIDHVCHNRDSSCPGGECSHRRCVNPAHLEAVDCRTNLLRGNTVTAARAAVTHCPRGHEYTPENTYISSTHGGRDCKICRRYRKTAAYREARANRTSRAMPWR